MVRIDSNHRRRLTSIILGLALILAAISSGSAGHSRDCRAHAGPELQAVAFSQNAFLVAKDHGKKPLSGILLAATFGRAASATNWGTSESFLRPRQAIGSALARLPDSARAPPVLPILT